MLGVLLLVAAGLKLYGLSVSAVPRVGWFAQPWVQLAAVEWELVLGLWLLSGVHPRGAWVAALLTFAVFAAVSGYLGWIGVASCGCFGTIQASPWWAFGVDVLAVATLVIVRPQIGSTSTQSNTRLAALILIAGSLLIFAAVALVATLTYGSPQAALARLKGEPISVSPTHLDMGSGAAGRTLESRVELTNWSGQTIRVVGGTSDCSCITHRDLPVSIPPGESRWITVEMRVPGSAPGKLTRQAILFTDHERQPTIPLSLSCQVE